MKKPVFTWMVWCAACCAQAELPVPISSAQVDAERSRIERQRSGIETQYGKEEVNCYQRFSVNDCLLEVRVRKRASLEELRRQEIALADAQRKTRALEQLRGAEERNSPEALKQEAQRREAAQIQHKERLDRAQQKKSEAAQRDKQADAAASKAPVVKAVPAQRPSAQEQQAFDEKQRSAQERKAQRDKAQAEKTGKPVQPLSVPP